MTVLNTIVADSLEHIAEEVEQRKAQGLEAAVNDVIVEIFKAHQRVVFNGNGKGMAGGSESSFSGCVREALALALQREQKRRTIAIFSHWRRFVFRRQQERKREMSL